jgi:hypothetical protein
MDSDIDIQRKIRDYQEAVADEIDAASRSSALEEELGELGVSVDEMRGF